MAERALVLIDMFLLWINRPRVRLHVYESMYDFALNFMNDLHASQIGVQFFI
jgi:hypothetical protein